MLVLYTFIGNLDCYYRTCYSPDRPANKFWILLFAGRKLFRKWLGAR